MTKGRRDHLKPEIDPDATPYSKFVNDTVAKILEEVPDPPDLPEPDNHQKAEIILGALGAVNAGVITNLLADPDDPMASMTVVTQLANETMNEIGLLKHQVIAGRNKQ